MIDWIPYAIAAAGILGIRLVERFAKHKPSAKDTPLDGDWIKLCLLLL